MRDTGRLFILSLLFLPTLYIFIVLSAAAQTVGPRRVANDGTFIDSGQSLGGNTTNAIALGDLDGDTDLDAFAANSGPNRAWFNNGSATFSSNGQVVGNLTSRAVALGDVNGDTFWDALVANLGANEVWLNNGTGIFSNSGQDVGGGSVDSHDVALADLDGDNDLDAFLANNGPNSVWLNGEGGDPLGTFSDPGQSLGSASSLAVAIGDVDGDTDFDAVVANGFGLGANVWFNDGGIQGGTEGVYISSTIIADFSLNIDVALGDLDGDTDLDIILTSSNMSDTVWINQGFAQSGVHGQYVQGAQLLSGADSRDLDLADLDGDGDLDMVVARWLDGNEVWFNQGGIQGGTEGLFADSGQALGVDLATSSVVLGDFDGDNDADAMFGNFTTNEVWYNGQPALPTPSFAVDARTNDDGYLVYPWAQAGDALLPVQLSNPAPVALEVSVLISSTVGPPSKTVPFATGEVSRTLTVDNPGPNPSQAVTLTLGIDFTSLVRSVIAAVQQGDLSLIFIDSSQAPPFCFLCFVDWIVKQMGIDTSFWFIHHANLPPSLTNSLSWDYYAELFQHNTSELTTILASHPGLLWDTYSVLEIWTPAIQAIDLNQGATFTVTQTMMDETSAWLQGIASKANPQLASRINVEMAVLDLNSFVGLNMDQTVVRIQDRIQGRLLLPFAAKP